MSPAEALTELKRALAECRFADAGELIGRMGPAAFSEAQAETALGLLRRKRLFDVLEKAAALFYFGGNQTAVVRRQWSQAVLDQNRVDQGLAGLKALLPSVQAARGR